MIIAIKRRYVCKYTLMQLSGVDCNVCERERDEVAAGLLQSTSTVDTITANSNTTLIV
jgi:hypothetical protein